MLGIRALRADEIECRIQQCTENGVMLLLYKDARCDMNVLDETFTPFGWQRRHSLINNKEFCTVSIRAENGEWIDKQDCGTESNTEKTKGETSDAFKRACSNWGIGRELYTKIPIFIKVPTIKNGNRYEMKDKYAKFFVSCINTDEKAKKILHLEISDKWGKKVFEWDNKNPPKYEYEEDNTEDLQKPIPANLAKKLFVTYAGRNEELFLQALNVHGYTSSGNIVTADYEKICEWLILNKGGGNCEPAHQGKDT